MKHMGHSGPPRSALALDFRLTLFLWHSMKVLLQCLHDSVLLNTIGHFRWSLPVPGAATRGLPKRAAGNRVAEDEKRDRGRRKTRSTSCTSKSIYNHIENNMSLTSIVFKLFGHALPTHLKIDILQNFMFAILDVIFVKSASTNLENETHIYF